jgi:hypothetical protein
VRDLPPQQDPRRRQGDLPAQGPQGDLPREAEGPGGRVQQRAQPAALPG